MVEDDFELLFLLPPSLALRNGGWIATGQFRDAWRNRPNHVWQVLELFAVGQNKIPSLVFL